MIVSNKHLVSVTKSNALIESSYSMTLNEQRLVLMGISKINPLAKVADVQKQTLTVTADEYAELFNVDKRNAYKHLQGAIERLWERDITLFDGSGKEESYRWIPKKVKYPVREGKVSFRFDPEILPYLSELSAKFKSYQIKQIANIKSTYTIRIYELLNQYLDTGWRSESIDRIRKILRVGDKYSNYGDLKRWVLEPAKKEMKAKTNIYFEYEPIKTGKKVTSIKFIISEKKQMVFPL